MFIKTEQLLIDTKPLENNEIEESVLEDLWKCWNIFNLDAKEIKKIKEEIHSDLWIYRSTPKISDFYTFHEIIGTPGQYGTVYSVTRKLDDQPFAVKKIKKKQFKKRRITKTFYFDLRMEVFCMRKARNHPNIVQIEEVFEEDNFFYIVMEKLSGGELFETLTKEKKLSEERTAHIFSQMVDAVYFLHGLNMVHCDLKPENFVFESKLPDARLKLIDFGMCKFIKWRKYYSRMQGTPYYVAPEILKGRYNEACDVWSLGVCLYVLVIGFPPFHSNHQETDKEKATIELHRKIRKGFTPKVLPGYGAWFPQKVRISSTCRDLIARLLRKNVADRFSISEILTHPWLVHHCQKEGIYNVDPTLLKSIGSYTRKSRLQRVILSLLRHIGFLNPSQEGVVKKDVAIIDKNGNGLIDRDELLSSLQNIDPRLTQDSVDFLFQQIGVGSGEQLTKDEILNARIYHKVISKEERLMKLFSVLDANNDNQLSAKELWQAFQIVKNKNGEKVVSCLKDCEEIIKESDQSGNNLINFEEFLQAFGVKNKRKISWRDIFCENIDE